MAQASGRQRREGSLPSGNNNTRKMMEIGNEFCASMASHAAKAPPGRGRLSEASATFAYCPKKVSIPPSTPVARKIQPITLPGRREEIRAPSVAKVREIT
jgi:hypothetical protein